VKSSHQEEKDMHVTSTCPRRRRSLRRSFTAVLMLALAGAGVAHAAGFDEKLKAPMMKSAALTHAQAKDFGARFREVRATTPSQIITNAALAREKFDLHWQVRRAIDERRPIEEFSELGFVNLGDGSYKIDMNAHPEWDDLAAGIIAVLSEANLDSSAPALIERGFRVEDVATLKNYIATHPAQAASASAALPVALAFAKTVRKFDKAKLAVPDGLVLSYVYQRSRAITEAGRLWVADLLKQFDPQRARVLMSTFLEFQATGTWSPTDTSLVIADALAAVRLPNFEELAIAEAKGVAP
jgi:hypothetical protein